MDNFPILAERSLILRDKKEANSEPLRVLIGVPYWLKDGSAAACPVAVHGLVGRTRDIQGIDTLQAIELAITFVNFLLKDIPPDKELLWADGEPYTL